MSYKVYAIEDPARIKGDCADDDEQIDDAELLELCEAQTITPTILDHARPGTAVLDAGCGTGRWLAFLSRRGCAVSGIDLSEAALDRARKVAPTAEIRTGDTRDPPYANDTFDVVLSLGVVEHFEDGPDAALRGMHRIIKPGGVLILTVPYQSVLRTLLHVPYTFLQRLRHRSKRYIFDEYRYTFREVTAALDRTGFRLLGSCPDDFAYPRALGLCVDWPGPWIRLTSAKPWYLNGPGRFIAQILHAVSPWAYPGAAMYLATPKK